MHTKPLNYLIEGRVFTEHQQNFAFAFAQQLANQTQRSITVLQDCPWHGEFTTTYCDLIVPKKMPD